MGFFNYLRLSNHVAIGVMDMALARTNEPPREGMYDRSRNVQRSFITQAPAFAFYGQHVPLVPLTGNGLDLQGQFAMTTLAQSK